MQSRHIRYHCKCWQSFLNIIRKIFFLQTMFLLQATSATSPWLMQSWFGCQTLFSAMRRLERWRLRHQWLIDWHFIILSMTMTMTKKRAQSCNVRAVLQSYNISLQFHKILAPNLYIRVFPSGDVLYRCSFTRNVFHPILQSKKFWTVFACLWSSLVQWASTSSHLTSRLVNSTLPAVRKTKN